MYHLIIFSGIKSIAGVQLSSPSIPECFHLPKLKLCLCFDSLEEIQMEKHTVNKN